MRRMIATLTNWHHSFQAVYSSALEGVFSYADTIVRFTKRQPTRPERLTI
jgi:hypothetical protein